MASPSPNVPDSVSDAPPLEGAQPSSHRHEHRTVVRQHLQRSTILLDEAPHGLEHDLGTSTLALHAGQQIATGVIDDVQPPDTPPIPPPVRPLEVQLPEFVGTLPGPCPVPSAALTLRADQPGPPEEAIDGHVGEREPMTPRNDRCESDRTIAIASAEREDDADELLMEYGTRSVRCSGTRHEACTTMSIVGAEPTIDGGTCNRIDHRRLRDRPLKCKAHNPFSESHRRDHRSITSSK